MCADTCKDAQRRRIITQQMTLCKRFLLLCNIFALFGLRNFYNTYKSIR
jgi:hypothetical protein